MKNKTRKVLAAGIILLIATITATHIGNSVDHVRLTLGEIETLASCEVKKNDKIIFQCNGDDEKDCKERYKSIITGEITIECSGTYVNLDR